MRTWDADHKILIGYLVCWP